jgi:pyruvate formate lyase activating enzyme
MEHLVSNIQRMCMQDGPGIRTTVFMKGCGIHCPWCSNPENLSFEAEEYTRSDGKGVYGSSYSIDEIYREIIKDKDYWGSDGGVTFSGGEALMHVDFLRELFQRLKDQEIHLAVETSLFVPEKLVREALEYIDFFYVDIKILNAEKCGILLGGDSMLYRGNVDILIHSGKSICFRIPCSERYTLQEDNKELILEFVRQYQQIPIEIFKLHRMGESKYRSLGKRMIEDYECVDTVFMEFFESLKQQGNQVSVIRL